MDIKSAAIAPDLAVLMSLDGFSDVSNDDVSKANSRKILLCLFYT